MEDKVKEIQDAIKAAKDEAAEVKQNLATEKEETEKKFANIDDSLKAISQKLDEIKSESEDATLVDAIKSAFIDEEFKANLADTMAKKITGFTYELKFDTTALTGDVNRTVPNTAIYGPGIAPLTFLPRLGVNTIPQDKNRIMYLNGSFTDNTDYVGEGKAVATANEATATEKYREIAKIGNFLVFTAEALSDTSYFVNWAQNRSRNAIYAKVDAEIWKGDGSDSSKPKHIYGLKGVAKAFNATTVGLATAIENPDIITLILAMKAQIKIQTNEQCEGNILFISESDFVELMNLRNANNDYIGFIKYKNELQNALNLEIVTTSKMSKGELFMAYLPVVQLHQKVGFELEVERVPSTDSYVMYLRWRGGIVVPDEEANALIYVADSTTAISSLAKAA